MSENKELITPEAFQIKEKLAQLEATLLESLPNMPVLLRDIHTQLKNNPDVVTILTEEECATLIKGLKQQTKTEVAIAAIKAPKKKSLKSVGLADL